jgi:very-short-patch-repair endonuclease
MILIKLIAEYKFHEKRKWRFDYANLEHKIAIEIEGGAYTNGRHTRGTGFINDMEKYNEAAILGWVVFRITPTQYVLNKHLDIIDRYLTNKQKQ